MIIMVIHRNRISKNTEKNTTTVIVTITENGSLLDETATAKSKINFNQVKKTNGVMVVQIIKRKC